LIIWATQAKRQRGKEAKRAMVTQEDVIAVLKTVEDPELFLDIWFLGLIYVIDINDDEAGNAKVSIEMTFTTPLCPAGPQLVNEVKTKVGALKGVSEASVQVVFEPPWQAPEEVKATLGML
jgi:metal-sulfur cluster biosynthetic enzyme